MSRARRVAIVVHTRVADRAGKPASRWRKAYYSDDERDRPEGAEKRRHEGPSGIQITAVQGSASTPNGEGYTPNVRQGRSLNREFVHRNGFRRGLIHRIHGVIHN